VKGEISANAGEGPDCDILVVDDDCDFADSLAQLLRIEGYQVKTAYSADMASALVRSRAVAVALVDLKLEQDNGVQLIRDLRAIQPELVAVIMTAYASVDTAVQAIQEGVYDYLCKPFFAEDVIATLQRCFERRRLLREREEAVTAERARNRELKEINEQLGQVLRSMQALARCTAVDVLCCQLLSAMVDLLRTSGGAVYLRDRETLHVVAVQDGKYPDAIPLPPEQGSVLSDALDRGRPTMGRDSLADGRSDPNRTLTVLPLLDSRALLLGALFTHHDGERRSVQAAVELGQILASFGAEAIQAAQAAKNLAESQERLSKIIKNSPSAISLKDLQGRYLLTNQRFDEWFSGGTLLNLSGPSAGRSLGWDGPRTEFVPDATVIANGGAVSGEVDVTLADGAEHTILMTKFRVLDSTGKAVGIGTIGTDITEQRRAEHRLRQAQRIEAIGQLTGGVAHDFNNLLSVILGNLRLLQEEVAERPGVAELLEEALDATKAGAELTGRLLAFGRSQTLRPQLTDVRMLMLDMSRLLERTLGEGIAIRLELLPELWQAEIDRSQLEGSILNLAINARDAMSDGGELLIRARNTVISQEDAKSIPEVSPGNYVILSVTDSGGGMADDILRKAIQPFFTTKAPGYGSGLGLSMVYGFIKQSKGHMELESELGQGTTVSLYFPASTAVDTSQATPEGIDLTCPGRGERVLLVEDQANVRRLTRRLLTRLDYDVLEAVDGQSALRVLERNDDIDILFTDVILPGEINGVMLARAALARKPDLCVLYTTGYASNNPVIGCHLQEPTTILLRKPIQIEELSRALRLALDQRQSA